eukprot:gene3709-biopygen10005
MPGNQSHVGACWPKLCCPPPPDVSDAPALLEAGRRGRGGGEHPQRRIGDGLDDVPGLQQNRCVLSAVRRGTLCAYQWPRSKWMRPRGKCMLSSRFTGGWVVRPAVHSRAVGPRPIPSPPFFLNSVCCGPDVSRFVPPRVRDGLLRENGEDRVPLKARDVRADVRILYVGYEASGKAARLRVAHVGGERGRPRAFGEAGSGVAQRRDAGGAPVVRRPGASQHLQFEVVRLVGDEGCRRLQGRRVAGYNMSLTQAAGFTMGSLMDGGYARRASLLRNVILDHRRPPRPVPRAHAAAGGRLAPLPAVAGDVLNAYDVTVLDVLPALMRGDELRLSAPTMGRDGEGFPVLDRHRRYDAGIMPAGCWHSVSAETLKSANHLRGKIMADLGITLAEQPVGAMLAKGFLAGVASHSRPLTEEYVADVGKMLAKCWRKVGIRLAWCWHCVGKMWARSWLPVAQGFLGNAQCRVSPVQVPGPGLRSGIAVWTPGGGPKRSTSEGNRPGAQPTESAGRPPSPRRAAAPRGAPAAPPPFAPPFCPLSFAPLPAAGARRLRGTGGPPAGRPPAGRAPGRGGAGAAIPPARSRVWSRGSGRSSEGFPAGVIGAGRLFPDTVWTWLCGGAPNAHAASDWEHPCSCPWSPRMRAWPAIRVNARPSCSWPAGDQRSCPDYGSPLCTRPVNRPPELRVHNLPRWSPV